MSVSKYVNFMVRLQRVSGVATVALLCQPAPRTLRRGAGVCRSLKIINERTHLFYGSDRSATCLGRPVARVVSGASWRILFTSLFIPYSCVQRVRLRPKVAHTQTALRQSVFKCFSEPSFFFSSPGAHATCIREPFTQTRNMHAADQAQGEFFRYLIYD